MEKKVKATPLQVAKAVFWSFFGVRKRAEYEEPVRFGQADSMLTSFRQHPLRFIAFSLLIAAVLYLSVSSFFSF